jgi:hypothetical protein
MMLFKTIDRFSLASNGFINVLSFNGKEFVSNVGKRAKCARDV